MNNLLKLAIEERKELVSRLENINKVIELLGGNIDKKEKRQHNEETRKKMKEAWAKRRQKEVTEVENEIRNE